MSHAISDLIRAHVRTGDTVHTVANNKLNRVASIDDEGVWLATEQSDAKGSGPQLVPWWMFSTAWDHLHQHRELAQTVLLHDLDVKRSAAVVAVLARLPGVEVKSVRPTVLALG